MSSDLQALRAYVLAQGGQNQAESTVRLRVTHSNLTMAFPEIRLDRHMTIERLKDKLSFHCGTSAQAMRLELRRAASGGGGREAQSLEGHPPSRLLGYFSPSDGDTLHVLDLDPHSASAGGWLEDTSKVEKYVMSDEAYNMRDGTYRRFKQERLREDPTWTLAKEVASRKARAAGVAGGAGEGSPADAIPAGGEARQTSDDSTGQAEAEGVGVGMRCEARGGRRGTVRHVGPCEGLPKGWWVGVEHDEPVGHNDGSTPGGRRYFTCSPGYGAFLRPALVSVGDFPPLDDGLGFSDGDEI